MIALRVFVILMLVLNTAHISYGWEDQLVDILKNLVTAFPIPYTSNIDLICRGQNAQLWFGASGTLDKDEDVLNGINPSLNEIEFSINATNFQTPTKGRYTCKISFQTFTFDNLLLLNLTGSSFDITEFVNNDFMKAIYSSFFNGTQGITYQTHWQWNSSAATSPDSSPKEYKISTLYSLINELVIAILHMPKSLITKLVNIGSLKETMFKSRQPMNLSKQGRTPEMNGNNNVDKDAAFKKYFKGKLKSMIERNGINTMDNVSATKKYSNGARKFSKRIPNTKNSNILLSNDNSGRGKLDKHLKSAALSYKEEDMNSDKTDDNSQYIAAIVAVSLLSLGIVVFISNGIIGLVVYHKYIKVRKVPQNIETGLMKSYPHRVLHRARKGPSGIRLTAPRVHERINSAPVISYVSTTPIINKTLVKPQEHASVESERINILTRSASEVVNEDSLTKPSLDNACKVHKSESSPYVQHTHSFVPCTPSNAREDLSSFSHACPGKHLYTMRKVSTARQLPRDNKDLNNHQPKIIHVKPINTL